MSFPTIQTADTTSGTVTSNSTSWTLTYPANIAAGDLLLVFLGADGSFCTGLNSLSGFSPVARGSAGPASVGCLANVGAGTETGTFTIGSTQSEQGGWRVFRITGWYGSGLSGTYGANDGSVAAGAAAIGADANPNPPSLDPGVWGTEDTLWFAACGVDTSRTISVYPLADNNTADVSGGAGGATLGLCTTTSAVSSLDPGTFTISASDDWAAVTVAVRPAAPVAAFAPAPTGHYRKLHHLLGR